MLCCSTVTNSQDSQPLIHELLVTNRRGMPWIVLAGSPFVARRLWEVRLEWEVSVGEVAEGKIRYECV